MHFGSNVHSASANEWNGDSSCDADADADDDECGKCGPRGSGRGVAVEKLGQQGPVGHLVILTFSVRSV